MPRKSARADPEEVQAPGERENNNNNFNSDEGAPGIAYSRPRRTASAVSAATSSLLASTNRRSKRNIQTPKTLESKTYTASQSHIISESSQSNFSKFSATIINNSNNGFNNNNRTPTRILSFDDQKEDEAQQSNANRSVHFDSFPQVVGLSKSIHREEVENYSKDEEEDDDPDFDQERLNQILLASEDDEEFEFTQRPEGTPAKSLANKNLNSFISEPLLPKLQAKEDGRVYSTDICPSHEEYHPPLNGFPSSDHHQRFHSKYLKIHLNCKHAPYEDCPKDNANDSNLNLTGAPDTNFNSSTCHHCSDSNHSHFNESKSIWTVDNFLSFIYLGFILFAVHNFLLGESPLNYFGPPTSSGAVPAGINMTQTDFNRLKAAFITEFKKENFVTLTELKRFKNDHNVEIDTLQSAKFNNLEKSLRLSLDSVALDSSSSLKSLEERLRKDFVKELQKEILSKTKLSEEAAYKLAQDFTTNSINKATGSLDSEIKKLIESSRKETKDRDLAIKNAVETFRKSFDTFQIALEEIRNQINSLQTQFELTKKPETLVSLLTPSIREVVKNQIEAQVDELRAAVPVTSQSSQPATPSTPSLTRSQVKEIATEIVDKSVKVLREEVISRVEVAEKSSLSNKDAISSLQSKLKQLLSDAESLSKDVTNIKPELKASLLAEIKTLLPSTPTNDPKSEQITSLIQELAGLKRSLTSLESKYSALAQQADTASKAESSGQANEAAQSTVNQELAQLGELIESTRNNFKVQLEALQTQVQTLSTSISTSTSTTTTSTTSNFPDIEKMINISLARYSADRVAKVDYASKVAGGAILHHSPTHHGPMSLTDHVLALFGSAHVYKASIVLTDDMTLGHCWPMSGSNGFLVIHLRTPIIVTHVTVEHISKDIAINYESAPRQMKVWGIGKENHPERNVYQAAKNHTNTHPSGDYLGEFEYNVHATIPWQTFPVSNLNENAYKAITVGILNNYGYSNYTCIYRIRIHGRPKNQ